MNSRTPAITAPINQRLASTRRQPTCATNGATNAKMPSGARTRTQCTMRTSASVTASAMPVRGARFSAGNDDAVTDALVRIVHWVLVLAPLGIFALVAPFVAQVGWRLVLASLWFIGAVIAGVLLFIAVVYLPSVVFIARVAPRRFFRAAFASMLMGFSTTSSMAALPTMIDAADKDLQLPRPVP